MNYYLDQEFQEYFKKPISWLPSIGKFNKPYHTIDLISIGLVCEDGREYYAVCNEFDLKAAIKNSWLYEKVLTPILGEFYLKNYVAGEGVNGRWNMNKPQLWMIKYFGKTKKRISQEIKTFICSMNNASDYAEVGSLDYGTTAYLEANPPVFYGYYADYDWVLFCSLFGTMMDLPKGFPMYCIDLKQILDEKAASGFVTRNFNLSLTTLEERLDFIKARRDYPKQENEHNALADAKWNKNLHDFIKQL